MPEKKSDLKVFRLRYHIYLHTWCNLILNVEKYAHFRVSYMNILSGEEWNKSFLRWVLKEEEEKVGSESRKVIFIVIEIDTIMRRWW